MPTPTTRLRAIKVDPGTDLNVWGLKLNTQALDLLDEAIAGVASITLAGTEYTLTSANYATDQARRASVILSGTGNCNLVIPSLEKSYDIVNNSSGAVTVKTSGVAGVSVASGSAVRVVCDGTNVHAVLQLRLDQVPVATSTVSLNSQRIANLGTPTQAADAVTKAYVDGKTLDSFAVPAGPVDFDGEKIVDLGTPFDPSDAATKAYVDATAFASAGGTLPSQTGNAGYVVTTNGTTASYADAGAVVWAGTAGGTATALTLSPTVPVPRYTAGMVLRFLTAAQSSGAATVAVSGLAATDLVKADGVAVGSGDMLAGAVYTIVYDGTQFRIAGGTSSVPDYILMDHGVS